MQHETFGAAKDVRVDEDVVVDQDEATCEYEDVGSHEGDEDGGELEEEQDGHLLACLCRTLILITNSLYFFSLRIVHFVRLSPSNIIR